MFKPAFVIDEEYMHIDKPLNEPLLPTKFEPYSEAHSIVYPNLYLGSLISANNYQWLKQTGITHIAGLIDYQIRYDDMFYLVYPAIDDAPNQNIVKYFAVYFDFIDRALNYRDNQGRPGKVLIHCHAGISRSSTIVIGYLMFKLGYSYDYALALTVQERNIVNPNHGFRAQLEVFNKLAPLERVLFCGLGKDNPMLDKDIEMK
jgi:protein-tyrosine phosphatase